MQCRPDTADALELRSILHACATVVRNAILEAPDWSQPGTRPGQYLIDLIADDAAVDFLVARGFSVISEESGSHTITGTVTVVLDPLDGTVNAVRGLPWFGISLCAINMSGPIAAVVLDLGTGTHFDAALGHGARAEGYAIKVSECTDLSAAVIGYSGLPPRPVEWSSGRAIGSLAIALCHVATGSLDGLIDYDTDVHSIWDYLGGLLICTEAGAIAAETHARDLMTRDPSQRRSPALAGTPELLDELLRTATH
jgi:fructose-1,6-bisphosphatase/inositol monophosphatase family enzyme